MRRGVCCGQVRKGVGRREVAAACGRAERADRLERTAAASCLHHQQTAQAVKECERKAHAEYEDAQARTERAEAGKAAMASELDEALRAGVVLRNEAECARTSLAAMRLDLEDALANRDNAEAQRQAFVERSKHEAGALREELRLVKSRCVQECETAEEVAHSCEQRAFADLVMQVRQERADLRSALTKAEAELAAQVASDSEYREDARHCLLAGEQKLRAAVAVATTALTQGRECQDECRALTAQRDAARREERTVADEVEASLAAEDAAARAATQRCTEELREDMQRTEDWLNARMQKRNQWREEFDVRRLAGQVPEGRCLELAEPRCSLSEADPIPHGLPVWGIVEISNALRRTGRTTSHTQMRHRRLGQCFLS